MTNDLMRGSRLSDNMGGVERTCFVERDHSLAVLRDVLLQQLVLVDLLVERLEDARHGRQVVLVLLRRSEPRDEGVQVRVETVRLRATRGQIT